MNPRLRLEGKGMSGKNPCIQIAVNSIRESDGGTFQSRNETHVINDTAAENVKNAAAVETRMMRAMRPVSA